MLCTLVVQSVSFEFTAIIIIIIIIIIILMTTSQDS